MRVKLRTLLLAGATLTALGVEPCRAQSNTIPQVEFRVGRNTVMGDARRFAARYVDYIAHAERAYFNFVGDSESPPEPLRSGPSNGINPELNLNAEADPVLAALGKLDDHVKARWTFVRGYNGPPKCPEDDVNCKLGLYSVPGLAMHVWRRNGAKCREIVIAFRGTDRQQFGDWVSNAHWATRWVPFHAVEDQYHQVRRSIIHVVREVTRNPCYDATRTRIVTVGHSLGGGLAQHAAYAHGGINRVYAVDSSPVTGISDFPRDLVRRNTRGLIIERIYERGEALELPRYLVQEALVPPSVCNPKVRIVAFNTINDGSAITQHSSSRLAIGVFGYFNDPIVRTQPRLALPDALATELRDCERVVRMTSRRGSPTESRVAKQRAAEPDPRDVASKPAEAPVVQPWYEAHSNIR